MATTPTVPEQSPTPTQRIEESGAYSSAASAAEMARIGLLTLRYAASPPFTWFREMVVESSTMVRRCIIPLVLSLSLFVIANGVLLLGNVLATLGVADRQAGGIYLGLVREVDTWITMMILAGVGGSAVTSDIAARKIREELDALSVLGVDSIRTLIVPRVLAFTVTAVMLGVIAILISLASDFLVAPSYFHLSDAVFIDSVRHNVLPSDIIASVIKHAIIGFFLGVVFTVKGLTSRGGAEGVGRSVNQAVVIAFFGIWMIQSLFELSYLSLFPGASVLRG